MLASMRLGWRNALRVALLPAALVLPISAICALLTDQNCNHLQGNIEVAEPQTSGGRWCAAVNDHGHWILLAFGPPLVAALIVLIPFDVAQRRDWLPPLMAVAWLVGCAVSVAVAIHVQQLPKAVTI
jgi:hypothetical protein